MIGGLIGALEWLEDAKRCWLNENNGTKYFQEARLHMKEIKKAIHGYVGYRVIKEKGIRNKTIDEFLKKICEKYTEEEKEITDSIA